MSTKERELYSLAQKMLVGSLLAEGEHTPRVLELIEETDIEEPKYNLIFTAIAELARKNDPIDILPVAEELEKIGHLKDVGGPPELVRLKHQGKTQYTVDGSIIAYARIVKESSAKAKIARILEESAPKFNDDSGVQAADAVADIQSVLNERLLSLSDTSTISTFNKGFRGYKELLEKREQIAIENADSEGLQGIPSLLPTINRVTGGWKPGQFITVGAETGVGKSVYAINCAVAAGLANCSVMMFSLEMSREQIEDRIYASTTGISINNLKSGKLTETQKNTLEAQMEAMKDMKLTIDTEPNITVDGIRAKALRQAQTPDGLDFIIIDYLQLITPSARFSTRQEAVADISRNVKLLAKNLNIPIMVLVQLKRKDDDDPNTLPDLNKIRESAAIAQDSDIVILLHRDQPIDDTTPHTLVIVDKNRDGENKVFARCHSNLACSLFREVTRVKDVEERLSDEDEDELVDNFDIDQFNDSDTDILSDDELGF